MESTYGVIYIGLHKSKSPVRFEIKVEKQVKARIIASIKCSANGVPVHCCQVII